MSEEANQDSIVAIKPCCGRIVFAVVNLPNVVDADMKKEIGELAAIGCRIEHWKVEDVRRARWGCKCDKK